MNPGGYDYEAWAFQNNVCGSGYLIDSDQNKLIDSHFYHNAIDRIRQALKEKILAHLPESKTSPWILALTIGERQNIAEEYWDVLRKTGTNHLMAIAGLHIGLMSGFVYVLFNWLWRLIPRFTLYFAAQQVASVAALLMAVTYSGLAGFSLPTQRACIMLAGYIALILMRRKTLAWQIYCIALLSELLINPMNTLSESFWLSFVSVALIIYGVSGRLAPTGLWWKWGRIQWVIALGLIPMSIHLFHQCSLVSFVANSIAIPWVGFIVVPLSLFGCLLLTFSNVLGTFVLMLADKILGVLWVILTYLSHISWASWSILIPQGWMIGVASVGIIILLLPAGFPGRYLGAIGFLPLLFYRSPSPQPNDLVFTLLDVGQGLSAVLQTKNHILVFDAGAKWNDHFDMGANVVVPFLYSIGAKKVDMIVVSHGDNDHIGGVNSILKTFPVAEIKTSDPKKLLPAHADYCLQNQTWDWDGVHFSFLYPAPSQLHLNNDSSCVLKVVSHDHSILLTGDIEKNAEQYLHEEESEKISSDILVAPHHGSKTSIFSGFLQDVDPKVVLFSVGYLNRYHFPHVSVVKKYETMGVTQYRTDQAGAITYAIKEKESELSPNLFRYTSRHYWNY